MQRIWLAIRVFFLVLFNRDVAKQVGEVLARLRVGRRGTGSCRTTGRELVLTPKAKPCATRSEAVTLLATLQREARFIDFVMEPLASYSDAQIVAVARDVHRAGVATRPTRAPATFSPCEPSFP